MLDVDKIRALGKAWFGGYLDPDWKPRTPLETQRLLAALGLTSEFWDLV